MEISANLTPRLQRLDRESSKKRWREQIATGDLPCAKEWTHSAILPSRDLGTPLWPLNGDRSGEGKDCADLQRNMDSV